MSSTLSLSGLRAVRGRPGPVRPRAQRRPGAARTWPMADARTAARSAAQANTARAAITAEQCDRGPATRRASRGARRLRNHQAMSQAWEITSSAVAPPDGHRQRQESSGRTRRSPEAVGSSAPPDPTRTTTPTRGFPHGQFAFLVHVVPSSSPHGARRGVNGRMLRVIVRKRCAGLQGLWSRVRRFPLTTRCGAHQGGGRARPADQHRRCIASLLAPGGPARRGDRPAPGVVLLGEPWVLVRVEGRVRAFADRCPHRGCPLSLGQSEGGGAPLRLPRLAFRRRWALRRDPGPGPRRHPAAGRPAGSRRPA